MTGIGSAVLAFFAYAWCGWALESIVLLARTRRRGNPGFLTGPIVPVYACGADAILIATQPVGASPALVFTISVIVSSVLEFFTHVLMERLFGLMLWNYDGRLGNIQGRVCLANSLGFGLAGLAVVYVLDPALTGMLAGIDPTLRVTLASVLIAVGAWDCWRSIFDSRLSDMGEHPRNDRTRIAETTPAPAPTRGFARSSALEAPERRRDLAPASRKPMAEDRNPRLGIALASGAAFGAAHAGVLLAVEEAGLRVDVVTGASAGALVGGAWAAGMSAGEIIDRLLVAGWPDIATPRPSLRLGLLDTQPLRSTLNEVVRDVRIEDMPVRFGAVVTSLVTARPQVITSGPLVDALLASSAVPGLFPPVEVDGRPSIDGGLLLPLPARTARMLGAQRVIAVTFNNRPRWRQYYESHAYRAVDSGDITVSINTEGMSHWSCASVPQLIDMGRRAGDEALSEGMASALLEAV
ncbi:MAG: patatin-like phospholipase family protein [Actinomyces sp.]|jgi:NTE family protein|nr:patatin-like phospholipase family protein [Actinomyces sp.]MCI1662147.1 patatin-like phospholipase family protein [Actinomyces sp.]